MKALVWRGLLRDCEIFANLCFQLYEELLCVHLNAMVAS